MKAIILIINFNNHNDLKACVESCFGLSEQNFHILIIENGSSEPQILTNSNWLISLGLKQPDSTSNLFSDKISYVISEKNLGFGNGNNFGFEWVRSFLPKPEYIWLLNNDTDFERGALTALIHHLERNKSVAFAGSLILDFEERNKIQAAGGVIFSWSGVTKHLLKGKFLNEISNFNLKYDYQCGASILVRYSMIEKHGGFRPEFFLYFEETDWQLRMKKLGWENELVPESRVFHKESASTRDAPKYFFYNYFFSAVLFLKFNFRSVKMFSGVLALLVLLLIRSGFKISMIKEGLKGIKNAALKF